MSQQHIGNNDCSFRNNFITVMRKEVVSKGRLELSMM